MLRLVLVVLVCVGLSSGRPQAERDAHIVRSEADDGGDGNFVYSFDTSNSIAAIAAGRIKNPEASDPDDRIQEIVGCYSYIDTEGQPVVVTYIADENGYQPTITTLQTCPDLNTLRGGVRNPAPAPARPAARPQPLAPPVRAPAPPRTTPQPDDGKYRVIDENGNVVAILPKSTNLVG